MAATVSAANIKNAMKAALDAIVVDGGEITNDAGLQAIADAIANEVNTTIVASYLTHVHTYVGAGTGSSPQVTPPPTQP